MKWPESGPTSKFDARFIWRMKQTTPAYPMDKPGRFDFSVTFPACGLAL